MQNSRDESKSCNRDVRHLESERDQHQAKDADGSEPKDVVDEVLRLRLSQQHLVPHQRDADEYVRYKRHQHSRFEEGKVHSPRRRKAQQMRWSAIKDALRAYLSASIIRS